jgi:hypothetical protein
VVVVALLLLVAYVGAYASLRATGRSRDFWPAGFEIQEATISTTISTRGRLVTYSSHTSWLSELFRPCVAIEEWCRNR